MDADDDEGGGFRAALSVCWAKRSSANDASCTLRTLEILIDLGRCRPAGEVAEASTTIAVDEDDDRTEDAGDEPNASAKMRAESSSQISQHIRRARLGLRYGPSEDDGCVQVLQIDVGTVTLRYIICHFFNLLIGHWIDLAFFKLDITLITI
jgi:hypothetical protein